MFRRLSWPLPHLVTSIKDQLKINDSISRTTLLKCCNQGLEDIQHHLESTYLVYRDSTKSVSKKLQKRLSASFEDRVKAIKSHLDQNQINTKLQNIILCPIQELIEVRDTQISMYRIEYLEDFSEDLLSF